MNFFLHQRVNLSFLSPSIFIALCFLTSFSSSASGTVEMVDGYRVVRGERPPIEFGAKDTAAWHQNVLVIKFTRCVERHLKENPPEVSKEGIVSFQLEGVDSLNARFGVALASRYFLSPALNNTFTDRHKAWGFHLWYRLETTAKSDILQMMDSYAGLPEVEITTPSFRKILHSANDMDGAILPQHIDSQVTFQHATFFDAYPLDGGMQPHCSQALSLTRSSGKEDSLWVPDDPLFGNQWAFQNSGQFNGRPGADISWLEAMQIEKGDSAVIVALVDGGIDLEHEDLAGNLWPQIGYNFVHDSPVIEPHHHGTVVAGIVAALNNNDKGIAGTAGGSGQDDGVRLMTAQVFAESGSGGFHLAQVYAADNGAAISQNSWSFSQPGVYNPAILDAFDYFVAYGGGDVLEGGIAIAAAGNNNDNGAYYPGYYSAVLSVTGTTNRDEKAWYSNYGSYIDLSAPAGETNTVEERGVLTTHNDDNYGYTMGTSVACPFVSGTAALLASYAYRNNHILTNTEVWQFLVENTDDINQYNPQYQDLLGSGRLNAHKALQAAQNTLGNVSNPGYFSAVASTYDYYADLSWRRNNELNNVLILYATSDEFGTPENGTLYGSGDFLEGGGKVLYSGSDTLYTHTGLDEHTTYYYRAFSYDSSMEYSHGRTTTAATYGGNLRVRGLNTDYTHIPVTQMPPATTLRAEVKNKGLELINESMVNFSVQPAGYNSDGIIPLPLGTGEKTEVIAGEPWESDGLDTGSYTITWEAMHPGSDIDARRDTFMLNLTDSLYSRDSGSVIDGIGSNTGPIIFGMPYDIYWKTKLNGIQIQWPDRYLPNLDFRVALYEVNDDLDIIRTVFLSTLLTRTPEMQNTTHSFPIGEQPVVIEPGTYMLAFKQLNEHSLRVGFDGEPRGHFYRADHNTNPGSFPNRINGYGNLALRMILIEYDHVTGIGDAVGAEDVLTIWVYNNTLYVDNPLNSMEIALYDIRGLQQRSFSANTGINSFPLRLPPGIYFIHYGNNGLAETVKVIVH
ncbi:MAG: T9SS C-terminal target domain-containing protein [Bacteroidia bacterium]|nr:MAG: T9SS C-terminal target domain-containing protein [Bacteroidia bacterium]